MNAISKTFNTPEAAAAFMMGFNVGQYTSDCNTDIEVRIDPEEPQTILADLNDKGEGIWLEKAIEFNHTMEQLNAPTP